MKATALLFAFLFLLGPLAAQTVAPTYEPSEVQSLRLQLKQKDAKFARAEFLRAQQHLQEALSDLNDEAEKVKAANHWPKEVTLNLDSLKFAVTEAAPGPPPPKPLLPQEPPKN